jgi:hypothetical protein
MRTPALPLVLIAAAAAASFVLSVTLWFTGSEEQGIFVGLWVPSILSLGALTLVAARR